MALRRRHLPAPHRPTARGFTLIEAVMAMAICAIVLAALQGTILIAAKAAPSDSSPVAVSLRTAANLDYLATDLNSATDFVTLTPNVIEFYLADRNSDGNPDLVRYEWSGVPGAPLLRRYTTDDTVAYDTPSTVVPAVDSLSFTPLYRTDIKAATTGGISLGGATTTAEQSLDAYDTLTSTASLRIRPSGSYYGCAQVITPTLPSGTTKYRITRAQLRLSYGRSPYTGQVAVSIRAASGSTPTSTILASATVAESGLSSGATWVTVSFPDCPDLDPTKSYAIAVTWLSDTYPARVQYRRSGVTGRPPLCRTSDGNTWQTVTGASLLYRVYGTATLSQGTGQSVTATASTSATANSTTMTSVAAINVRLTPSVAGAKNIETCIPCYDLPPKP